jgi:hypothetical protein
MKQLASVPQDPMLRLALWLLCLSLACSSGKATTREQHGFSDAVGHACQATLEKTSSSSPVVSESVSCDREAKQCSSEATPCFQLSIDRVSYAIVNCPACCKGSASSFAKADCSPLVCETDADCVYAQAKCADGACSCPTGYCD